MLWCGWRDVQDQADAVGAGLLERGLDQREVARRDVLPHGGAGQDQVQPVVVQPVSSYILESGEPHDIRDLLLAGAGPPTSTALRRRSPATHSLQAKPCPQVWMHLWTTPRPFSNKTTSDLGAPRGRRATVARARWGAVQSTGTGSDRTVTGRGDGPTFSLVGRCRASDPDPVAVRGADARSLGRRHGERSLAPGRRSSARRGPGPTAVQPASVPAGRKACGAGRIEERGSQEAA